MKRVSSGVYQYHNWTVRNMGYHQPDRRVVWEAVDNDTLNADAHGYSKKEIKYWLDKILESEK